MSDASSHTLLREALEEADAATPDLARHGGFRDGGSSTATSGVLTGRGCYNPPRPIGARIEERRRTMGKTRTGYLDWLVDRLGARGRRGRRARYRIPVLWNSWGYQGGRRLGRSEIEVDPYEFALDCLRREVLPRRGDRELAGQSLSQALGDKRFLTPFSKRRRGGDWLRATSIYGLFVRATTAWDHDGDGDLSSRRCTETGTFLKSILLLPMWRRMGIGAIYLLPVSRHSNLYRKGEWGCPYSAKNFFEIEPSLHDRLVGDDESDVQMEFGAFVEAAHAMGMRVLLDLAPRTASRDSDLILDHPDWFYWIDRRAERGYASPYIEGAKYLTPPPKELPRIHAQPGVREHLAKFRFAPNVTAPTEWRRFVARVKANRPRDLVREIGREFGVVTPPGFSDVVNDEQPPWSDVTFLRYFWDHPVAAARCLPHSERQPPYLLSEVIKSSRFEGARPNLALWKTLADILPFYQRFGVDGARIDMGHALPNGLERMILESPRRIDPDFAFIAEELGIENSANARRAGYNMIIGPSWWMEPRASEGRFHELVNTVLPSSKLPIWAAAETADTPRSVVREGGKRFAGMASAVNHFLPNAVPFLNSGMEVHERQPMNLGLDNVRPGRYALKKTDPFYGKLAFFDRYALHWGNAGAGRMVRLVADVAAVRARFVEELADASNGFVPKVTINRRMILAVGFLVQRKTRMLLVLANTDFRRARRAVVTGLPRARRPVAATVLLEIGSATTTVRDGRVSTRLAPGGVRVMLL